ncbi:MAG TPA: TetR/AcrR family transcriptional regulator [Ktedonobacteraceae bacterium]|jgi:AcrR family transcriptional regulator
MVSQKDGRVTATRQRILTVAETLYHQGGYNHISLQVIADQLQLSKPALFYHFENKQALFFDLLLTIIEQHRLLLMEVVQQKEPLARQKLSEIMQQLTQKPRFDVVRFIHQEYTLLTADQQQKVKQAWRSGVLEPVRRVLEEGIHCGDLRPHRTHLSAYMFLHLCLLTPHIDLMVVSQREQEDHDEPQEILLDLFIHGLGLPSSSY